MILCSFLLRMVILHAGYAFLSRKQLASYHQSDFGGRIMSTRLAENSNLDNAEHTKLQYEALH